MPRILSIDFGLKRSGIAVSDTLKIIANGLTTVDTRELHSFLKQYIAKESVDTIVIGMPKRLNNEPADIATNINIFADVIREDFKDIKVVLFDERFTSAIAQRAIIDGGVRKSVRRNNKGLVDQVSATILLQDYMEQIMNY